MVDFGIAKAENRETETRAGMVKGKFSYMSPEQCLAQTLDRRSDVFALGIILFELCTARRLFKRGKTYQTYEAITKADVPSPRSLNPKIDPGVEAVIMKALQRLPENRYDSADAMQEALEQAMHRAGMRGSRTDLEKFLERTFDKEFREQQDLLSSIQRGDVDRKSMIHMSAVAENAAAELNLGKTDSGKMEAVSKPQLQTPLPQMLQPLGDDSKPTQIPEAREPLDDGPTRFDARSYPTEGAPTVPELPANDVPLYQYVVMAFVMLGILAGLVWYASPR